MSIKALQAGILAFAASVTLAWPAHFQPDTRIAHPLAAAGETGGASAQAPVSHQTVLQQEFASAHLRPQLRVSAALAGGGAPSVLFGVRGSIPHDEADAAQSGLRLASPGRAPPAEHS